jgi:membrane-associated phospholipid phosphatase
MNTITKKTDHDVWQLLRDTTLYIGLWPVIAIIGCHLSYAAAALNLPLHDGFFMKADHFLDFDWFFWYSFVDNHPSLHIISDFFYLSINWQAPLSVVILAVLRRERLPELMTQFVIGLVLSIAIYALIPALGPAYDSGVAGNDNVAALLLRSGGYPSEVAGIVAFPSLHTAMAFFYIYAQRQLWTVWPIAALNILMLITVPISGDHYLIDMIAGGLLACFVIVFQKYLFRMSASRAEI